MTLVTFQDGKIVMRDGKVGTEQACCCDGPCPLPLYAYIGGGGDPEVCEGLTANLEWFLSAMLAAGWTASIKTDNKPPEVPQGENSCWGYIDACCNTSDIVCPPSGFFGDSDYENQPEWFNVSDYDGGIPAPDFGVNWWLCNTVLSQPVSPTAGAAYIPVCNPLP